MSKTLSLEEMTKEINQYMYELAKDGLAYARLVIGENATLQQISNFLAHEFPEMTTNEWRKSIAKIVIQSGGDVVG